MTTGSRLKIATAIFLEFDSSTASVKKLKYAIPCVILVEREKRSKYKMEYSKIPLKWKQKKLWTQNVCNKNPSVTLHRRTDKFYFISIKCDKCEAFDIVFWDSMEISFFRKWVEKSYIAGLVYLYIARCDDCFEPRLDILRKANQHG